MGATLKLADLGLGDKVCLEIYGGFSGDLCGLKVGAIERVTATQITALGDRWLRDSGRMYGDNAIWNRQYLRVWTPELQDKADRGGRIKVAEAKCYAAADVLRAARGDDAVRLAALLPPAFIAGEGK